MAEEQSTQAVDVESVNLDNEYTSLLGSIYGEMGSGNIVNILTDYPWAVNYSANKGTKLPRAYVHEYRQNLSTFASTLAYYTSGTIDGINFFSDDSKAGDHSFLDRKDNAFSKILGSHSVSDMTGKSYMAPYNSMYHLDEANCNKYVFPYYENSFINVTNSYGDSSQQNTDIEAQLSDTVQNNVQQMAGLYGNVTSALKGNILNSDSVWDNSGIYIERPKYFQFAADGEAVTIKFPLYNTVSTGTTKDVWEKNYKFIKNFALKNLPFKVSMFRYKTPLLYEIAIPGVKYLPISYVSNYSVSMKGTRRMLRYSNLTDIIVPDAWEVSITFTSLIAKTANAFAAVSSIGPQINTI